MPLAKGEGWQLETNSAEAYERYLVPALMMRWAGRLLDLAGLKPGERVLDVACGTGVVARQAAPRVGPRGRVVGLDLNEGMLAVARTASSAIRPPIEWRQGNATSLPFGDGEFDLVLCHQALQFVSDRSAAVREMRRVLAASGRAAVGVCRPIELCPGYPLLAEALRRHVGPEAEAMMRSPFPSWTIDDARGLLAGAGFGEVRVAIEVSPIRYPSPEEFLRQEAACSPLAGLVGALSREARSALVQDLTAALRSRCDDEGVVFPIETYLVLARRQPVSASPGRPASHGGVEFL
jgi:ubiquinone/menaquinone biosynthesis C-methylase UbiE